ALDADHEGDRLQDGVAITDRSTLAPCTRSAPLPVVKEKDPHGPRSPAPRARPSRICGYDRKIPCRPAREADQHLSHAAQRSPARGELVQSLQYGAMADDASRPAARDRDHPRGPSRQRARYGSATPTPATPRSGCRKTTRAGTCSPP